MPGKNKSYTLGSKRGKGGFTDLELPSGDTCQARRPGIQGLIEAGLLDSFDQLTAIVQEDHIAPNTPGKIPAKVTAAQANAAAANLSADKEKLHAAILLMDKLTAYVVVQPPVWIDYKMKIREATPKDDGMETDEEFAARADPTALGVRDIDLDDKMFILNWAIGGSSDLAAFREGSQLPLANVESVQAL